MHANKMNILPTITAVKAFTVYILNASVAASQLFIFPFIQHTYLFIYILFLQICKSPCLQYLWPFTAASVDRSIIDFSASHVWNLIID